MELILFLSPSLGLHLMSPIHCSIEQVTKTVISLYTEIQESKNRKQKTSSNLHQQGKAQVQNHSSSFTMMEMRKLGKTTPLTVGKIMYFRGFPAAFLIFVS